jgi:hypothetical protein
MNDKTSQQSQDDPLKKYKKNPNIREIHRMHRTTTPTQTFEGMPKTYESIDIFYETVFLKVNESKYPSFYMCKTTGKWVNDTFKVGDKIYLRKTITKHDGKAKPAQWLVMDDVNYHPIKGYKMSCDTFERLQERVFIRKEWI